MKKLQKISLKQISKTNLDQRQLCRLLGGSCCQCGCHYANDGGSSTTDNYNANEAGGLYSDPGNYCGCGGGGGFNNYICG